MSNANRGSETELRFETLLQEHFASSEVIKHPPRTRFSKCADFLNAFDYIILPRHVVKNFWFQVTSKGHKSDHLKKMKIALEKLHPYRDECYLAAYEKDRKTFKIYRVSSDGIMLNDVWIWEKKPPQTLFIGEKGRQKSVEMVK